MKKLALKMKKLAFLFLVIIFFGCNNKTTNEPAVTENLIIVTETFSLPIIANRLLDSNYYYQPTTRFGNHIEQWWFNSIIKRKDEINNNLQFLGSLGYGVYGYENFIKLIIPNANRLGWQFYVNERKLDFSNIFIKDPLWKTVDSQNSGLMKMVKLSDLYLINIGRIKETPGIQHEFDNYIIFLFGERLYDYAPFFRYICIYDIINNKLLQLPRWKPGDVSVFSDNVLSGWDIIW